MRACWRVLSILIFGLLFISACASNEKAKDTPAGGLNPVVATEVARTLTSIAGPNVTETGRDASSTLPAIPISGATSTPTPLRATPTTTPKVESSPTAVSPSPAAPTPTATGIPTSQPTPTIGVSPTPAASQTPAVTCIDKAGFFGDVTVPDDTLFQKSSTFLKTWRIRNVGTCNWGDGYQLVFADGHILGGPPSSPLPKAAPGDIIDISVNMKAPADGGTYIGDWEFQNPSGKRFGVNSHGEDKIWVKIRVDWGPGVGPTPTPPPVTCAYTRNADYEAKLLQLINSARAGKGLPALTIQSQLSAAAFAHSVDMACNNYLDHSGSDGSNYSSRIKAKGYNFSYDSENIYAGGDPQVAFDWWMNSQIHRDNILSPKVTQIGIGHASYSGSNFGDYYTLDFAKP